MVVYTHTKAPILFMHKKDGGSSLTEQLIRLEQSNVSLEALNQLNYAVILNLVAVV